MNGIHAVREHLRWGGELGDDSKPEVVHAAREEDFRPVLVPIFWFQKSEVPAVEGEAVCGEIDDAGREAMGENRGRDREKGKGRNGRMRDGGGLREKKKGG